MKILYYTNLRYAWDVQGTTKSIAEEMSARGHRVLLIDKKIVGKVLEHIKKHGPASVWLASTGIKIESKIKDQINIPVVGFGFSDPPIEQNPGKFLSYDIYVTNYQKTFEDKSIKIPTIYSPIACDFKFHKNMGIKRDIDASMIGLSMHPRLKNERILAVEKLRESGTRVVCFGAGWADLGHKDNHHPIGGERFLNVINRSKIGIDIEGPQSALAHRMLEYSACGVPCITRRRPEIANILEPGKEVLVYDTLNDMVKKVRYYLEHEDELTEIGQRAFKRCQKSNNITHRIDHLEKELLPLLERTSSK